MTKTAVSRPAGTPGRGAPGAKLLLTALSLAATLGGWGVLTSGRQIVSTTGAEKVPAQPLGVQALARPLETTLDLDLPALPTVTPLRVPANVELPAFVLPPIVATPPPQAPALLRVVSLPPQVSGPAAEREAASAPAPVTNTRPSR